MTDQLQANPFSGAVAARPSANDNSAVARTNESRAVAQAQALLLMAKRFPRDPIAAMDNILNQFARPTLAEMAKYQYSKGGTNVDGPSIRSAETIAQSWGNIDFGFNEIGRGVDADGVTYSEVEAFALDTQSLTRRAVTFRVRHWRDTKTGGYKLKDDRDINELVSNQAQRRVRACILAVIPGDVVEAAMEQAETTLHTKADTSPEAIQKMLQAFETFNVSREQISKLIQRRIESITPAQVVRLKKIYASLRDNMSSPSDWFEPVTGAPQDQVQPQPTSGNEAVKIALAKRSAKKEKIDSETGEITTTNSTGPGYAVFEERIKNSQTPQLALDVLEEATKAGIPKENVEELKNVFDRLWS